MADYNGIIVGKDFPIDYNASFNLIGVGDGPGDCQCNGTGVIVATRVMSGPYDHQPMTGKGRVAIFGKGGWYIAESETVRCPLCSGDKDEIVHYLIDQCNVPLNDRVKSLDYFDSRSGASMMVDVLRTIIDGFPECHGMVTIFGPHDTGKTTAAQIVVLHGCRAGVNAVYLTSREIVYGIKATWGNADKTEEDYIHSLSIPKLLVIDEVDMVRGGDADHVRAIIDARYRIKEKAMTILITNEDISRQGGDEYIRSRMKAGIRIPVT